MAKGLFDNLRALFTSLGSSERRELEELWEQNGGKVTVSVTPNDPPHVVVTRRVGSAKYISLMRRHPNTHVVPPEWILKSVEMKKKQPYSQFRVGCLYGLKICLSGFDVDKKAKLADLISRNGGTHSPSLTKFCTHLVSDDRKSQKYTFAMKHGILCCSLEWLEESTRGVKWCRDATKYQVKDREISLLIPGKADAGEVETSGVANIDTRTNTNTWDGPRPNSSARQELGDPVLNIGRSIDLRYNTVEGACLGGGGSGGGSGAGSRRVSVEDEDVLQSEETCAADPSFLKGCAIWYIGLSRTELKELVSLCCKSGATRVSFPHPTLVTHIIQGSETCTRGEWNEVSKAMQSAINPPHIVTMEWLRASVHGRQELDADNVRFRPPKDDGGVYTQHTNKHDTNFAETSDNGRSIQATLNLNLNQTNTNDASNASLSVRNDGIFSGYYFTLCAIRGTRDESVAEVLIRQHGGKINNTSVPASGEGTLLAICPASLTRIEASRLRAQNNNNFGNVPEDNRFTVYWIKCCAKAQKMLMHQDGAPCFRPLPFELPLDGMSSVSISASGYDDDVKMAIRHTVETIGGRFSTRNMSARDTHLIVPFAHGEKYRHSQRLGVVPVTSQWLVESVKAGRILPESRFRPGPKPGCEPDPMAPGDKLGPVETTQHPPDADQAIKVARDVVPARKRPPAFQKQTCDLQSGPAAGQSGPHLAMPPSEPAAKKPRTLTEASEVPIGDDLEKAGMQVTSLISRLQPSGPAGGTTETAAPKRDALDKEPAARPSKRSSSRRIGLNQSEDNKARPSVGDQGHGQMNFDAMVEVSQRVGYE